MATLSNVISEVLYEEKNKSLKLFYKVDVLVQNFPEEEPEEEPKEEPTEQPAPEAPAPAPAAPTTPQTAAATPAQGITASTKEDAKKLITEEVFKSKSNGEISIPQEEAENIQTMDDLLDYLSDKKEENGQIINDLVIEIILTLAGLGQKGVDDVINKGDKVIVDLDYGFAKDDSIGIKVNKLSGSDTATLAIKKDGKILPGPFVAANFNKYLLYYRNALVD